MLKNALIYRFEQKFTKNDTELDALFKNYELQPCLSSEMQSVGWVPVFRNSRNYAIQVDNFIFFKAGIEEKILPQAAIDHAINKRADAENIVLDSRAKRLVLREKVLAELMHRALTKINTIFAYIDLEKQWLVIDASNANKASVVCALLRKTLGSLSIVAESPTQSVQSALTYFAQHGVKDGNFEILEDIEIKSLDEEGGQAKIKCVPICATEIQQHIEGGWQVNKLSMMYRDRLQFTLSKDFIFKRLKFTDLATESIDQDTESFLIDQSIALIAAKEISSLVSNITRLISGV